jgi:hypothetical protein
MEKLGRDWAWWQKAEEVLQEKKGSGRVEESFVPAETEVEGSQVRFQAEGLAKVAQGMRG